MCLSNRIKEANKGNKILKAIQEIQEWHVDPPMRHHTVTMHKSQNILKYLKQCKAGIDVIVTLFTPRR